MKGEIFVVSAPSGAGKTTILKRVLEKVDQVVFSVSHTTRPPRKGERDGVDYFFVSEERFMELVRSNAFIEWARVHNHLYGTSRAMVDTQVKKGIDVILDVDVQGARSIRKNLGKGVFIFIVPPSMEELRRRLFSRGTESRDALETRLRNACKELEAMGEYDFVVVNDCLDQAVSELRCIITAMRLKVERMLPSLRPRLCTSNA